MIKKKKVLNTVSVSIFLIFTLIISSSINGEATNSILSTDSNSSQSSIQSDVNSVKPSENGLKAEDFLNKDELPTKEGGDTWTDYMYTPDDFLSKENVTMDDFENKILTRMLEVVSLVQTFAKPFCILLFIICALGVLMSIIFDTKKQKMFILGLILSVVSYVAIIFAPTIVLFFSNWLSF